MKLTLCYVPFSCALVPYVKLTEAGAEFEVMTVDFGIGQHYGPEYRRLNPKHKVPMLVIDGEPLAENIAIQIWIARTFQKARLLPAEPKKEIEAISLMAWCASTIQPSLAPNVAPRRFCDLPDAEDSVKKCAYAILAENFAIDHSGRLSRRGSAFQPGVATFNPCGFTHAPTQKCYLICSSIPSRAPKTSRSWWIRSIRLRWRSCRLAASSLTMPRAGRRLSSTRPK